MKKIVVKLSFPDDKGKQKAMQAVSSLPGVESMSIDKDMKLTVIGDVDPLDVVKKLRKKGCAELASVGPKEEKKEEKKKEEKKEEKKVDPKEEEEKKKKQIEELYKAVKGYNPYTYRQPPYYVVIPPAEQENPNNCVIC